METNQISLDDFFDLRSKAKVFHSIIQLPNRVHRLLLEKQGVFEGEANGKLYGYKDGNRIRDFNADLLADLKFVSARTPELVPFFETLLLLQKPEKLIKRIWMQFMNVKLTTLL